VNAPLSRFAHGRELFGVHRATEMMALAFATVLAPKECELLACLDPLGDNRQLERPPDADDCADDRVVS
jgi:hypothetical protein